MRAPAQVVGYPQWADAEPEGRVSCLACTADRVWGARGAGTHLHSWAPSAPGEADVWQAEDLGALVAVTEGPDASLAALVLTCHRPGALQLWDRLGLRLSCVRSSCGLLPVKMTTCAGLASPLLHPPSLPPLLSLLRPRPCGPFAPGVSRLARCSCEAAVLFLPQAPPVPPVRPVSPVPPVLPVPPERQCTAL